MSFVKQTKIPTSIAALILGVINFTGCSDTSFTTTKTGRSGNVEGTGASPTGSSTPGAQSSTDPAAAALPDASSSVDPTNEAGGNSNFENPVTKVELGAASGTNAVSTFDDQKGVRREVFSFGADTVVPVSDFLFVVDNSPSMKDIIKKLRAGLATEAFPAQAKVGVINTYPADPKNFANAFNEIYNAAPQQSLASGNAEPGFLRLVNKASIANYKSVALPENAAQFPLEGCEDGWFDPGAKNSKGERCFDAHTQISLVGGPCEPGIVAYKQMLIKAGNKALFRKDAVVNVVFVSDTHDPGCKPTQGKDVLIAELEDYEHLKTRTFANSAGLSSLKFHSIAPNQLCNDEDLFERTYADLAKASKGVSIDICTASDFKGVLKDIAGSASPDQPNFRISKAGKKILKVTVDGVASNDYELKDGDLLTVKNLSTSKKVSVEVVYTYE